MATANHVLLQRITLTASASSVTFDSIPQTGYTDLKIVASARTTYGSTVEASTITFNGSNTYSTKYLQGDGSSAASGSQSILNAMLFTGANATANTFGNAEMYIPNYTGTTQKSVSGDGVSENNGTQAFAGMFAGLASLTSAITTITIAGNAGGSFVAGSSFSLYGIADVNTTPKSAPKADGGDIIKTDGTYWYHAFLSTGLFKPQLNLTADVLVVAGGGGGGHYYSCGGGGAGGLLGFTSQALASSTNYVAVVGSGGTSSGGLAGANGSDSQFGSLTLVKGGGGGAIRPNNGSTGGSGGGGAGYSAVTTGGAATSGQGYAGGGGTSVYSNPSGTDYGGGGGGAGAAGGTTRGQDGGIGSSAYSSWGSATGTGQLVSGTYYYAGGGGGYNNNAAGSPYTQGLGGAGGGGNGNKAQVAQATAGVANTGGGGGGGWDVSPQDGRQGGSGIIIIRYPV